MLGEDIKFVDFKKHCDMCKHENVIHYEEPCNECLETPVRTGTEVPLHFEKK